MNINEFTEDEDKVYCDKINDDFIYFLNAIPDIEISEVNDGRTLKLRSSINDNGDVSFGDIFFELQWMLHRFKEKNPDFIVDKMLVSKLMLTSKSIAKELNV